jgi:hypothetical protein
MKTITLSGSKIVPRGLPNPRAWSGSGDQGTRALDRARLGLLRLFMLAGLLMLLMLLSLGCASVRKPLEREADFIGFITEIHPNGQRGVTGQVFVESHADKIVTRYVITVTNQTLIFRQDGDDLRKATFKTLENKQWVKIWWAGPTTGTLPVQGTAAQIVIE